ncbi:hypothetical protein BP5796_06333 [Coleophoma crateriformis]|uniref:Uncharacterized protein n=1 Tax=Coleophoma crateriformis TaxID=565419 RepID=A0A3D8RXE4_9HELO|nr:hypothetical protein BP5796_06333 [Coleophoma crateriformis]
MEVEDENDVRTSNVSENYEVPVRGDITNKELKAWLKTAPVIIDSRGIPWNDAVLSYLCKIKIVDSSLMDTTVNDNNFWNKLTNIHEMNLDLSDQSLDGKEATIKEWITQACSRLHLKTFTVILETPLPEYPSGTPISPAAWNLFKFCNSLFARIAQIEVRRSSQLKIPCRAFIWEAHHNRRLTRGSHFYPEPDETLDLSNEGGGLRSNAEDSGIQERQRGSTGKVLEKDKNNKAERVAHDGEGDSAEKEMTFSDFLKHLGFSEEDLESDEEDDKDMTFLDFVKYLGFSEKDLESDDEDLRRDGVGEREKLQADDNVHSDEMLKHRGGNVEAGMDQNPLCGQRLCSLTSTCQGTSS